MAKKQRNSLYVKVFPVVANLVRSTPTGAVVVCEVPCPVKHETPMQEKTPKVGTKPESRASTETLKSCKKTLSPDTKTKTLKEAKKTVVKKSVAVKKFFFIRHVPSALVLDVGNWQCEPGTSISTLLRGLSI